jgi:hypothetical protein
MEWKRDLHCEGTWIAVNLEGKNMFRKLKAECSSAVSVLIWVQIECYFADRILDEAFNYIVLLVINAEALQTS